jgi:hypothetical protein
MSVYLEDGWAVVMAYTGKKSNSGNWSNESRFAVMGKPGSSEFNMDDIIANSNYTSRSKIGDGDGIYPAFLNLTNVNRIAFVDGTDNCMNPLGHNNYLVYDLCGNTGDESLLDILLRLDDYQKNSPGFHNNDNVWGSVSVVNHTAAYSGVLTTYGGNDFRSNDEGQSLPEKICIMGINRDSDNDIQALCSFSGNLTSGKGDSWRGDNPAETFWSYWGHDFHSNSQIQRIGNALQTTPGLPIGSSYDGIVYMLANGSPISLIPDISTTTSLNTLIVNQDITPIVFTNTGSNASWSITPSLPNGIVMDPSSGTISGSSDLYDVSGTIYTVTAENLNGSSSVDIVLRFQSNETSAASNSGLSDASINDIGNNWVLPDSSIFGLSGVISSHENKSLVRRNLINLMFSTPRNNSKVVFLTTKEDLSLPETFTKEIIRVYRKDQTIDLATLEPEEGAYSAIYDEGETATFINVGGNQTVIVTANGDGTYSATLDDVETGQVYEDGETHVIAGVSFIFGSVGTEGTNDGFICFKEGLVLQRNGSKPIEDFKPYDYFLNASGQEVQVKLMIRSICTEPMVLLPKGCFSLTPTDDTIVSREHLIQPHGYDKWVKAVDLKEGIEINFTKPPYVYHILAEGEKTSMIVNGLVSETLDPTNLTALLRQPTVSIILGDGFD